MDEIKLIEKRLRSAAADGAEEGQLIELFRKACEGLSSRTAGGVRGEVEERLDEILEVITDKAAAIKSRLRG